jgi:hypothetical protein
MTHTTLENTILRIEQMEQYFDTLLHAVKSNPDSIHQDEALQTMLHTLIDYYEHGQWLADYTLDEQGLLPTTLKRGVLSQDGVYNLLEELNQ